MESQPDHTPPFCSLSLAPGDALYHQGQTESHIYVIDSGHLKLEHVNTTGAASISAASDEMQDSMAAAKIGKFSPYVDVKGECFNNCFGCHVPAKDTEWVYIEGHPQATGKALTV